MTSVSLKYVSTDSFAASLGFKSSIPSWDVGGTPSNEVVGTGDNVTTDFYLDHQNIIKDSYVLYANGVVMTDVTHYVLDLTTGGIVLTGAGVTLLNANGLTAKYSYFNTGVSDSYISDVLKRAEVEVDTVINSTFTDGTSSNPSYPVSTEIQSSNSVFQDKIFVSKKPLIDIESSLSANITDSVTSIVLASGDGTSFPSSGYVIIGSEVVSYTSVSTDTLTGCSRGVLGTSASSHSSGDKVHSTILFVSNTSEGSDVVWSVQQWDSEMFAVSSGLLSRFSNVTPSFLSNVDVANRIKIIYYYGLDSVPEDIVRLTMILAKRMLMSDNVGRSMIVGRNEFRPEMFNADREEMLRIINSHIVLPMGNT